MRDSENLKEILLDLGYQNITDMGKELRAKPIYRDSDSSTVLRIRKDTGHWVDFSKNISGTFEELVRLSLGLDDIAQAKEFIASKWGAPRKTRVDPKPEIRMPKVFSKESLSKMVPEHEYWIDRGVSLDTVRMFKGGVIKEGRMKDRYVFPVFNHKEELIGASGRDLINDPRNKKRPKWKHVGNKSEWKYPLFFNYKIIKEKNEAILVESIGDMLSLWDAGVKNTIVTFGLDASAAIINFLLRYDTEKICVSLNNDADNNFAGNEAAKKLQKKLRKYFDEEQVNVKLPTQNDFGEMTREQINHWYHA
jgi:5S rRNA maturation endonuclease (ribonuclease M5)